MFSVSEVQTPAELQAFSMFRAWWDVVLDYLVAATALNVLILMSRISSIDTGGLVCVHPDQGVAFGYVESRYINSRCCRGSIAWLLIFYPYVLFFEWMLITAILVCWIKIPSVFTKLDTFYDILSKIFTVQPKSYRTTNTLRVSRQLAYNEANEKTIDVLLNRLLYLMTERPFLRKSYLCRYAIVIFMCICSVGGTAIVIALLKTFPSTFLCHLNHNPPTLRGYPSPQDGRGIYCHLNIGPFVYVQILINCTLRIAMALVSSYGFYWALRETGNSLKKPKKKCNNRKPFSNNHRRKDASAARFGNNKFTRSEEGVETERRRGSSLVDIDKEDDILGQAREFISGLPGYPDLLFCIELLRKNTHDGHLMYDSVCGCIRRYVFRFQVTKKSLIAPSNVASGKTDNSSGVNSDGPKPRIIKESVVYVRWICNYLGFTEVPNSMDSSHLFECIEFIKDSLSIVDVNVTKSLREQIADEIQSHPELYKTLIDDDPLFPDYETHCSRLRSSDVYGSHYVLLAASTLLNVKLVIIHCEPVTQLPEIYLPMRNQLIKLETSENHHTRGQHHADINVVQNTTALSLQRRAHGNDCAYNFDDCVGANEVTTRFLTYVSPHFYHATDNLPINRDWATIVARRLRYASFLSNRRDVRSTAVRSVVSSNRPDSMSPHPNIDSPTSDTVL